MLSVHGKDTGEKGLSFSQIVDHLEDERRHVSSCDTFSSEGMKKTVNELFLLGSVHVGSRGSLHTWPRLPQPVSPPLFAVQLLRAPLGWAPPAAGRSRGTARARWLQKSPAKNTAGPPSEAARPRKMISGGIPMSFAASSGLRTWKGEENPLWGEKNAGKFFDVP